MLGCSDAAQFRIRHLVPVLLKLNILGFRGLGNSKLDRNFEDVMHLPVHPLVAMCLPDPICTREHKA